MNKSNSFETRPLILQYKVNQEENAIPESRIERRQAKLLAQKIFFRVKIEGEQLLLWMLHCCSILQLQTILLIYQTNHRMQRQVDELIGINCFEVET